MKHFKLTEDLLYDSGACKKGHAWFKDRYPKGLVLSEIGMQNLVRNLLLRNELHIEFFNNASDSIYDDTLLALHWMLKKVYTRFATGKLRYIMDALYEKETCEKRYSHKEIGSAAYKVLYNIQSEEE